MDTIHCDFVSRGELKMAPELWVSLVLFSFAKSTYVPASIPKDSWRTWQREAPHTDLLDSNDLVKLLFLKKINSFSY